MYKLKVGILEDNKDQLKERKFNLEETGLAEVIVWATNSEEFLKKLALEQVDAVVLDIDLGNDSMNGLEVAFKLKLHTLFVSSYNAQHLKDIEVLERDSELIVSHITKPCSDVNFIKSASKFLNQVKFQMESSFVYLDFSSSKRNKILVDSIVYLCADKAAGATSNNKQIFFTDRKPEILIDFTFSKRDTLGLSKNKFLEVHRSFIVNEKHIKSHKKQISKIEVLVINELGQQELKLLPVSENFRL